MKTICNAEVSFDYQYSLPKVSDDDEVVNLWLADYDEDNQDEIYVSYNNSNYWCLIEYNQNGDTLSVFTQLSTDELQFSRCKLFKTGNTVYLIVIYNQVIDEFRKCIIRIYDFESNLLIDSDFIDIGDTNGGMYGMGDYFITRYLTMLNFDNSNYIYLGLQKGYNWDEDGGWSSTMYKYLFNQNTLSLIESVSSCGYELLNYEENDFLIAFHYEGSWWDPDFYSNGYSINLVSQNSPVVVEEIMSINSNNSLYLTYLTKNDDNFQDYGLIIWISSNNSQQFRCYSPDFSQILWESSTTGSVYGQMKASTSINTNQGDHFILYFYKPYGNVGNLEVRNRITGYVALTQESDILPFDALRNSNEELLFFNQNETEIDVYTLSEEIQVSIEEFEIEANTFQINNYPNPFNPTTTIEFSIQNNSNVELMIYNIKGQKIKTLVHSEYTKGNHSIIWNGDNEENKLVNSGVYLYKLNINGKSEAVKKCLLLK